MPSNGKCAGRLKATDAEIVAFQRAAFRHKTGKGLVVELDDDCALPIRHEGGCAAHLGCLGGYPASAWLRWGDGGRRVDWLADCPAGGCALFLAHPGDCDPRGVPGGDRRWHLNDR